MSLLKKQNSSLYGLKEKNPSKYEDLFFNIDTRNLIYLQENQRSGGEPIITPDLLATEDSRTFLTEDNKELEIN